MPACGLEAHYLHEHRLTSPTLSHARRCRLDPLRGQIPREGGHLPAAQQGDGRPTQPVAAFGPPTRKDPSPCRANRMGVGRRGPMRTWRAACRRECATRTGSRTERSMPAGSARLLATATSPGIQEQGDVQDRCAVCASQEADDVHLCRGLGLIPLCCPPLSKGNRFSTSSRVCNGAGPRSSGHLPGCSVMAARSRLVRRAASPAPSPGDRLGPDARGRGRPRW